MFVFTDTRVVKQWPERLLVGEDGGNVVEYPVAFDLELLPEKDYLALLKEGPEKVMNKILKGWSGIGDKSGAPMADTPENRNALFNWTPFTSAVLRAYRQASSGEAARKN
ncbi:hypothetical protein JYB87_12780 [Shewanella avicenniae]|uniref:Uncharacterized protein n=1 Tax=Shewanella avicenniae TaxID=2814294 RepID=A0ABX7QP25_9GAMM|nr:hypothetical protein [Shewanella avicenniae]QSX32623.1 hypothetical protein JYB87_12780 [Shewanella avicenniae]